MPAESSPPLISARSLTKVYEATRGQKVVALEGVSFDVSPGQFVTLVGPSGCGKGTLLRLIAGLHLATSGEIQAEGKKIEGPIAVGIVFQTPVLMPWMSVLANILLLSGMPQFWIGAVQGVVLLVAVGIDRARRDV